jgi:hypothetical protein
MADQQTSGAPIELPIRPETRLHEPKLARTLHDGPGNQMIVSGCSCGAEIPGNKAWAEHVGWPADAVEAVLALGSLAYDLIDYPGEMPRGQIGRAIALTLAVPDARLPKTTAPYEIRDGQIVGTNLSIRFEHVIELLHMRHEDDPKALPTASTMAAIAELVDFLNGAYEQGVQHASARGRRR